MAFALKDLPTIAIGVMVGAVIIGIGATVTHELSTDLGYNATDGSCLGATSTAACDASNNGTLGLGNLGSKIPLIGTIAALAIVLGVVFYSLAFRRQ